MFWVAIFDELCDPIMFVPNRNQTIFNVRRKTYFSQNYNNY